ncbi:MAG: hypothetical protein U0043_08805 [Streptococcus sp.]
MLWQAPSIFSKTGGIYMSLHWPADVPLTEFKPYTILVAVPLSSHPETDPAPVQIKWVNDIYLPGQKVTRNLIEAISSMEAQTVTDVIIGVGINTTCPAFPKDLAKKAGNLFQEKPTITRQELITAIWNNFFQSSEERS